MSLSWVTAVLMGAHAVAAAADIEDDGVVEKAVDDALATT
jgi:hypothetical protein